jgi:hypothetical protein
VPPAGIPAASAETTGSTATPPAPTLDLEATHRLLEKIVDNISNVSRELSGIKAVLEQGVLNGFGAGASDVKPERTPPVIPLDFEAFLVEQEVNGKKDGI